MSRPGLQRQLLELDFPHLCRITVTLEVHSRCIDMWHDGKEYVVGIREKLCRRARVYYHGSKAACTEAYKILKDAISNPDSQQCTQS